MAKVTPSQIRERTRNEVAMQFHEKIKNLKALVKSKDEQIAELQDLYHKAATELSELKAKNNMQEEWIERMQDFCNMTEEDRKEFIEQQRTKHRLDRDMECVMDLYSRVFM